MKKLLSCVAILLCICALFCGCGDVPENGDNGGATPPETVYHTVTFKQDGESDVVITVESGKAVSQESIPTVKPKAGHTVAWEEKDLSSVTQDIIVNAIATPNTYKIFLDWNTTGLDVSSDKFNQTEQGVNYGGTYKLPTYGSITESGWNIDYWQNVQTGEPFPTSGTYTLTKNVSLKAVWAWYGGTNS